MKLPKDFETNMQICSKFIDKYIKKIVQIKQGKKQVGNAIVR